MNQLKPLALALLALVLLPGVSACRVTGSPSYTSRPDTFVIGTFTGESGQEGEYRLVPGARGGPAIHKVSTQKLEVAFVGVTPKSVDGQVSANRGIEAWRGVLLSRVAADSSAKDAGLRAGDVILSIDGQELTSAEQCKELVETRLAPEQVVDVIYMRRDAEGAWSETSAEMTVRGKEISETSTDRFPLEAPNNLQERAGLEVVTVPAWLAGEIWGEERASAIVTGVVVGSSAYHSGVRQGDRVVTCDGEPVQTAEALSARMAADPRRVTLTVDGPLGPHTATIDGTGSIDERRSTYVPILYDHESSVDRSATAVLNFIFQFGFTKRHRYLQSSTRESAKSSSLSILPLGLFEFRRTPTKSTNTLFWFITWSTRR